MEEFKEYVRKHLDRVGNKLNVISVHIMELDNEIKELKKLIDISTSAEALSGVAATSKQLHTQRSQLIQTWNGLVSDPHELRGYGNKP